MTSDQEHEHRAAANRAIAFSAAGLALTGGIELALALLTHSVALLGDALHNLSDVSTSGAVFLGFFLSRRPPSQRYTYGYERAEDLAGLGVALVIWSSAIFAGYESYEKLVGHGHTSLPYIGMAAALLGMAGNYVVAAYKRRVGARIHSIALLADARHSWLDVLSSFGALLGLVGVALGYRWADPVAGLIVMFFIFHVGYEVTVDIGHHLMDGIDAESLTTVQDVLRAFPAIEGATVRGRWMGRSLLIEVEGGVAEGTSLREIEALSAALEARVRQELDATREVRFWPRSLAPSTAH